MSIAVKRVGKTLETKSVTPVQNASAQALVDRAQAAYEYDVQQAEIKRKQNQPPTPTSIDRSPIPSYNIVSQGYYIGYHPSYGVVLAVKIGGNGTSWLPLQLLNKKSVNTVDDANNEKFNQLSRVEFDTIRAAKPSYAMLQAAYASTALQRAIDNIIERMSLNTATIVW